MFSICPRCQLEISDGAQNNTMAVCPHCGFVKSSNDSNVQSSLSKQFMFFTIGVSSLFILSFVHAVNWGEYFFESIPLKVKVTVGSASARDFGRLGQICKELKDTKCVESMLKSESKLDPKNTEALGALGQIQFDHKQYKDAAVTLANYSKFGGKNLDVLFAYAKALAEVGQTDKSIKQLEKILAAKPGDLQVPITQTYVHMLIKDGRNDRAKAVIQSVRSKGRNAGLFMEKEMRKLASQ